jgi:integrase
MSSWQKTRISNLFRYTPTGEFVFRHESGGKTVRTYLGTSVLSVAKWKASELSRATRRSATLTCPTVSYLIGGVVREADVNPRLKSRSRDYVHQRAKALLASWPELEFIRADQLTEEDGRVWASDYASKYSPTNYNNTLSVLKRAMRLAAHGGHIALPTPVDSLRRVAVHPYTPYLPSVDEFRMVLDAMRQAGGRFSRATADFAELLACTGMRAHSEAAHLTWRDVDLATGVIVVRGAPSSSTKNSESRAVPLIPEARSLLERMRQHQQSDRVTGVASCEHALGGACKKLGLPHMREHDLRHVFATRCLQAGVDIVTLASWLGHKDRGWTLTRTYAHVMRGHSDQLAMRVRVAV